MLERTCLPDVAAFVSHNVPIDPCCPVSGNPRPGSSLTVMYRPKGTVLPVEELAEMMAGYVGGRGAIRGMEELVQEVAQRVRDEVGVPVRVRADLIIQPPYGGAEQGMVVKARA